MNDKSESQPAWPEAGIPEASPYEVVLHASDFGDFIAYAEEGVRRYTHKYIGSTLGGLELAEDVMQEAWLSMHTMLAKEGRVDTPERLIRHLIYTRMVDTQRSWFGSKGQKTTYPEDKIPAAAAAPDDVAETVVRSFGLEFDDSDAIFDMLPEDSRDRIRELFIQRYALQKKPSQIAEETGRTSGAVRIELFRAHKKIEEATAKAQRLAEYGPPKTGGLLAVLAVVDIAHDVLQHVSPDKRRYTKITDERIAALYRQFEAISEDDRWLTYTARQLWSGISRSVPRGQASCMWERYANERPLASLAAAGETTINAISQLLMRGRLSAEAAYGNILYSENLPQGTSVVDYFRHQLQ